MEIVITCIVDDYKDISKGFKFERDECYIEEWTHHFVVKSCDNYEDELFLKADFKWEEKKGVNCAKEETICKCESNR